MRYMAMLFVMAAVAAGMTPAKYIDYAAGADQLQGYVVQGGAKDPLVIIIHDWDGLTDYEVKRAEMLGELGYQVFAIDLYGKGNRPTEFADKRRMSSSLYADRETMRARMDAGLAQAKKMGLNVQDAVVAGYCFGGAAVLEWARAGANLKGFVAFHGGLDLPEGQNYEQVKGSILVLHGGADQSVSMSDVATLAEALEAVQVPYEIDVYSGAPHAFTVFGSDRYRKDADDKSWNRFLAYLKETR